MTGQKQAEHICFGCGKAGHIQINCPYKKAKSHAAAAVRIQKEADTGMTRDIAPTDDAQEGETPPEDEDAERECFSLGEEDLPQVTCHGLPPGPPCRSEPSLLPPMARPISDAF